jgi:acetyltransferase
LVTDRFQRKGLGTELLRRLIQFSHDKKLQRLSGNILTKNQGMQAVCKKLGFRLWYSREDQMMKAEIDL